MPECTDGEEVVGEINIEHCVVNIVCRYLKMDDWRYVFQQTKMFLLVVQRSFTVKTHYSPKQYDWMIMFI